MITGSGWLLAVVCAMLWPAPLRDEPTQTVIVLKNTTGTIVSRALATVSRPDGKTGIEIAGLDYWAVDERKNAVLAVGTDAAIRELRQMVALIDVRPKTVTLQCRILRTERDESGKLTTTVISAPRVTALNNTPASISVDHEGVTLTADILARLGSSEAGGAPALTIAADFGIARQRGAGMFTRSTRRIRQGTTAVFGWLPDLWGKAPAASAGLGIVPESAGSLPGYYLEMSATETQALR
ncbi:MAG: hypothetical protein GX446_02950 [Chthonomonadales bacterium]|nr:hypothetical protein [Chthonomonadales bacterium]